MSTIDKKRGGESRKGLNKKLYTQCFCEEKGKTQGDMDS